MKSRNARSLTGMNRFGEYTKLTGIGGGWKSCSKRNELSGFDQIGDEIGEPLSDADACARGIPRRLPDCSR